jgi:hypothetical protein
MTDDKQNNKHSAENKLNEDTKNSTTSGDTIIKTANSDSISKKNPSKIVTILVVVFCLAIPVFAFISALQNPAWVNSPAAKRVESSISGALLGNINIVTIPTSQVLHPLAGLTKDELHEIENGNYAIVSATDIDTGHGVNKELARNKFVVTTIGPIDLAGKDLAAKHRIVETVYKSAFEGDVDAVVESTEADIMMSSPWGHPLVSKLYESGAMRCVIFDGGHHIGSLGLKPNILLIPAMFYKNELYATHAFTRDSVNIEKLKQTIEREFVGSTIVEFSRMGIPVKNSSVMGKLGYQAILNISRLTTQKTSQESSEYAKNSVMNSDGVNDIRNASKESTATASGNRATNGSQDSTVTSTASMRANSTTNTQTNNQDSNKLKYIPMRSSIIFVSCDVGNSPTKDDICLAIKKAVDRQVKHGQKVRRVYAGITYGECQFPQGIPVPAYTNKELQDYLLKKLPYYTEIMSEPVSTWDIVKTHF